MNWKLAAFFCATACFAGDFELGLSVGYGAYRNASVTSPAGSAVAGFDNRIAAGAFFGEDLYQHLSGEVRYDFQDGGGFLSTTGAQQSISGRSHAVHYDFLLHARRREAALRPFVAFGGGIKEYQFTGPSAAFFPAALIHGHQAVGLLSVGAGVRYRVTNRIYVRGDFRDYITPMPTSLFRPAAGAHDEGFFHQFTPMVSVSFRP